RPGCPGRSSCSPRRLQSVCHGAWSVGQTGASTPVIGRGGLLRLGEGGERLRAPGGGGGGTAAGGGGGASSPDGGADENPGDGTVDVVSGGETKRCPEVARHAPGAAGGLGRAGGGGDRGGARCFRVSMAMARSRAGIVTGWRRAMSGNRRARRAWATARRPGFKTGWPRGA